MYRTLAMISFVLSLVVPAGVAAQTSWPPLAEPPETIEQSGTRDVALLIGVEDYLLLPDVPGAVDNIAEWETFLREGLGVGTIITMRNAEAVREEILAAAERVRDAATEDSTVWFVFVGHGAPSADGKDGVIVGADGQQTVNSLQTRSVPQSEIAELFQAGPQARTIMIVDACFSGRDSSGEALAKGAQPVIALDSLPVPRGVTLMTAAKATEFAGPLPGTERPAFSYLLLGALRGWADDGDGIVTAEEAVEFTRRELRQVVGRTQTPQLIGVSNTPLARGVQEARPTQSVDTEEPASDPGDVTVVHWGKTSTSAAKGSSKPTADDTFYGKGHAGITGTDGTDDLGPLLMLSAGIKPIRLGRLDLRLGAWLGLHTSHNSRAPARYTDEFFGTGSVRGKRNHWASLGAGPGVAYRFSATQAGLDRTLYLDTAGGFGAVIAGECTSWDVDSFGDQTCSNRSPRSDAFVGARLGGEFPLFDVAAFVMNRPGAGETVFGVGAGFSFDR